MKNPIKLDYMKETITITHVFAKKAAIFGTVEYRQMQEVRTMYPNFTVVMHTIKKNTNREFYKGLTYEFMEDYIHKYEPVETRKAVLKEYEHEKDIAACHSKGHRYQELKKWFLKKYPEVAEFGIEDRALTKKQEKELRKQKQEEKFQEDLENSKRKDNVTELPKSKVSEVVTEELDPAGSF